MSSIDFNKSIPDKEIQKQVSGLPGSTYEIIRRSAENYPQAPALSFFLSAADHRYPESWNYKQLLARITQTANLFHQLGATKETVIALVLPNLPEAQFVIWGGQAAGIVAVIDDQLAPDAIAGLLDSVNAAILVTLAPFPGADLWLKMSQVIPQVKSLHHLVLVNLADRASGVCSLTARALQCQEEKRLYGARGVRNMLPSFVKVHDFGRFLSRQPNKRLLGKRIIDQEDYAVLFCSHDADGQPRIALRRHRQAVAGASQAALFLDGVVGVDRNLLCGLPLCHAQSLLLNGLLPFSQGAHVILGTPQGFAGEGVLEHFWQVIRHHRIHFFSSTPDLYTRLPLPEEGLPNVPVSSLCLGTMPEQIRRAVREFTGLEIMDGSCFIDNTGSGAAPPVARRAVHLSGIALSMALNPQPSRSIHP